MNIAKRGMLLAQAAWVAKTVHLLPEPQGDRDGIINPEGEMTKPSTSAIRFVAVGDSLIGSSGVTDQSLGLTPLMAQQIADATGKSVQWSTHAKLGSTMRRVRYRFMDELEDNIDLLFLCAGTNDVLARRNLDDWRDDLSAVLDIASTKAKRVLVASSAQAFRSPRIPGMLSEEILRRIDKQTEMSKQLCASRNIAYIDMAHAPLDINEEFWASDGFHPSAHGYVILADALIEHMDFLSEL